MRGRSVRWWLKVALGVGAAVWVAACGGRDRPSDCTPHEFFNDQTKRCTSCPILEEPSCKPGCGFEIVEDKRGCPQARCRPACDLCEVGERFETDQSRCVACEGAPECEVFGCEGELRILGSFQGACPPASAYACGACMHPEEGCRADDQGRCVDADAGN